MSGKYDPDAAAAKREALQAEMADGIGTLVTSEKWQRYLDVQKRFHRYSFGNTLLIMLQRPDATRVMGYGTRDRKTSKPVSGWLSVGQQVKDPDPVTGEKQHGIAIWVPRTRMVEVTDANGHVRMRDGKPVKREQLTGWGIGHVFDISQTAPMEGHEPLPEPVTILAGADDGDVYGQLAKVAGTLGFAVEQASLGTRNGATGFGPDKIVVNQDRPPRQQVKTLAHELGHAILHRDTDYAANRPRCELEAESVAYVVLGSLGINAGGYSFGYVATWAGAKSEADMGKIRDWIKASGENIQKAAKIIITALEEQAA